MKYILEYAPPNEFFYLVSVPIVFNGSKEELKTSIEDQFESLKGSKNLFYHLIIGENKKKIPFIDMIEYHHYKGYKDKSLAYDLFTVDEWFSK